MLSSQPNSAFYARVQGSPNPSLFAYRPRPPLNPFHTRRWFGTVGYEPMPLLSNDEDFVFKPQLRHIGHQNPLSHPRPNRIPVWAPIARSMYQNLDTYFGEREIF